MDILKNYVLIENMLETFIKSYRSYQSLPTITRTQLLSYMPKGADGILDAIYALKQDKHDANYTIDELKSDYFVTPDTTKYSKIFVRLTPTVSVAFKSMKKQLKHDTGSGLYITSGYRSPAYQAMLLLGGYYSYYYDMDRTLKTYMPPGFSEHGNIHRLAIDVATKHGVEERFETTTAYKWMLKNAHIFGFYLSYPATQSNMDFEPWHWHFKGKL